MGIVVMQGLNIEHGSLSRGCCVLYSDPREKDTDMKLQTFQCQGCGRTWQRPAQRGRPPRVCSTCRPNFITPPKVTRKPAPPAKAAEPVRARPATQFRTNGSHHVKFRELIAAARCRVPAMLVGPAGSGKTTAAEQLAERLGLTAYVESCHPLMSSWDLKGFMGADGKTYHATALRLAIENGGVLLLDEMDASNPGLLTAINAIAASKAGQIIQFPDGPVKIHKDFILVAGCNTFGNGASSEYVGREQLDAATLDRFATIQWDYDLALERKIAGEDMHEWVRHVQSVRRIAEKKKLPLLVSPRAVLNGAALLRDGSLEWEDVERLVLFRGASVDVVAAIRSELPVRSTNIAVGA